MIKNKKGYFFSLDAFVALTIILGVVLFIKIPVTNISHEDNLQDDLLEALSNVRIGDLNNSLAQQLISQGNITNLNQSVLEQIGEFYANSNPNAQLLASSVLSDLNISGNIGIYFNDVLIAGSGKVNYNNASTISTSREIISGIQAGSSVKGYSSRAFLLSNKKVDYFYFGGYVGDGNITANLGANAIDASIEGAFSGNFSLYLNNQFVGNYTPPKDIPYKISLSNYSNYFSPASNYLYFKSLTNNLYVSGGYVRTIYNTTDIPTTNEQDYFPGIDGIMNLYQGFYVPNNLNSIDVFLHYNSSYDIFLTIGNKTVYRGNSSGQIINVSYLTDSYLRELFGGNYNQLTNRTVPLRLGIFNASYLVNMTVPSDVVSANDISGSMATVPSSCSGFNLCGSGRCCGSGCNLCNNNQTQCLQCGGSFSPGEDKIGESKNATKKFIDIVLNSSINRVGLNAYSTSALSQNTYPLSNNSAGLKAQVDTWVANGGTCICCGINRAVNQLITNSSANKSRSIVLMSDGAPTYYCNSYTDYAGSGSWGFDGTGGVSNPNDITWAINASCNAYNAYGIRVYAIGFGSDVNRTVMENIATCGHGNYYFGNVSQLESIYNQVAQDVITASYQEQTITGSGFSTKLYPDSYIHLTYNLGIPYGLVVSSETSTFGNNITQGSFNVPNDSLPYEARVVSYSGTKWTSKVDLYNSSTSSWNNIYDLGNYGLNFTDLGDPYFVYIPKDKIAYGNNTVRVFTGLTAGNYSGGSVYDKVIYTVVKNLSSYSPIAPSASGCTWNIAFDDGTNASVKVPANYSGGNQCYYMPGNIAYNPNDAIQLAVYSLLSELDLNSNSEVETKFTENDLSLDTTEVTGIPFTWETEVQVRSWR